MTNKTPLLDIQRTWMNAWPIAIADWSPFVQLHNPVWCFSTEDEQKESLTGSFAMIRLVDHSVVISLRQVLGKGLEEFAIDILAHEIGHHVYCPADLTDNARLLARTRRGLPGCENCAPMVANLYADLLINDRLQRRRGRNMVGVYQALKTESEGGQLWQLYMRTFEILWNLAPQTLTNGSVDGRINQDAMLGSRLIRVYSRDWLAGAGRFACLLLPYVAEEAEAARREFGAWCDTLQAGAGGIPDGLSEIDDDELTGVLHPAEDLELAGLDPIDLGEQSGQGSGRVASAASGRKTLKSFRDPFEYAELLKAAGVNLSERELAVRYYRERALPYLVPIPARVDPVATDPIPEGLEVWDPTSDLERVDWISTLIASPQVVPGVTTRERLEGAAPGSQPQRIPLDLYLGVDCSGSMRDPALTLSYPVLAGTILCLSALRAGAVVKVCLSGEPGKSISTGGFVRNQTLILKTLLNYLGTGYAFGIHRLAETFMPETRPKRPVHILIVSDYDMFAMLDESGNGRVGWDIAREAVQNCGGGGTYVLQLPGYRDDVENRYAPQIARMRADGWNVHAVNSLEELLAFARQFSRQRYQQVEPRRRTGQHA